MTDTQPSVSADALQAAPNRGVKIGTPEVWGRIYWTMVWVPAGMRMQRVTARRPIPSCNGLGVTHMLQSRVREIDRSRVEDQHNGIASKPILEGRRHTTGHTSPDLIDSPGEHCLGPAVVA